MERKIDAGMIKFDMKTKTFGDNPHYVPPEKRNRDGEEGEDGSDGDEGDGAGSDGPEDGEADDEDGKAAGDSGGDKPEAGEDDVEDPNEEQKIPAGTGSPGRFNDDDDETCQ